MERTKTGIPGLDDLIDGGIPRGAAVLISGGPGSGKTILATQFLYNGAKQYNEKGIFISFESIQSNIQWNIESFGWDIEGLQKQGMLNIYTIKPKDPAQFKAQIDKELLGIEALVHQTGAKRLVIDSITALSVWLQDPAVIRYKLMEIIERLKLLECTTLMTSETPTGSGLSAYSTFGVEEFVADGVIPLAFKPPHRAMFIRKMRGTKHSKKVHPLEINKNGISIKSKEEILWEAMNS